MAEKALIVGAGSGLSACLARLFHNEGMDVAVAARRVDNIQPLADEVGGKAYRCDVAEADDVAALFDAVDADMGAPDIVVFNPSKRSRGPLVDLDPEEVRQALLVTCYGGFLVAQQAAERMLKRGSGSILLTGASAGVKGYPKSAPFAMGKFGLRGLAQSMARELHPQNVHIGHFVIDGSIAPPGESGDNDNRLSPESIAETYLQFHRQHRSAWAWEIELRPWVETF
ncbi:MAG: SDR family oxidoreductase [Alphaproteobacteria bacterium]